MQKLDLQFTGGHPIKLDDFKVMQDGIIEVLKGLGTTLIPDPDHTGAIGVIIWGCSINHSTGAVDAGMIYSRVTNEFLPVDAHSYNISDPGSEMWVYEDTLVTPPGITTYQDTNTHNIHIRKIAKVIKATVAPTEFVGDASATPGFFSLEETNIATAITDIAALQSSITALIAFKNSIESPWVNVALSNVDIFVYDANGTAFGGTQHATSGHFKFKVIGKTVHVSFVLAGIDTNTGNTTAPNIGKIEFWDGNNGALQATRNFATYENALGTQIRMSMLTKLISSSAYQLVILDSSSPFSATITIKGSITFEAS